MKYIEIKNNLVYFKGRSYPIYFLTKEEWDYEWKDNWYARKFIRGYTTGGRIYIKEGTWLGLEKLILHEIGHIMSYKHTCFPAIMFPSWVGRLLWKWNRYDSL